MPDPAGGLDLDRFSLRGLGIGLTGGGGHLGREMALAIARAGGTVVIVGRGEEALEATVERAGSEGRADAVVPCVGDAGDPATFERARDSLRERGLPLHGWVNNAYAGEPTQLGELDRAAIEKTLRSGLVDAMMLSDLAGREMAAQGGGSIVNIASMYGLVSPRPDVYAGAPELHNPPAYGAAKAGLLQFTRYAAAHWAKAGVRVNALTPGAFPAPEVRERADFIAALEAQIPMGRIGGAEEIGGALVFLLSAASSYMTGQQVILDGGWTSW
jgi:NAD(P)-dependent dehydrogenase (short-subunit alcohol dehydrogenase family)